MREERTSEKFSTKSTVPQTKKKNTLPAPQLRSVHECVSILYLIACAMHACVHAWCVAFVANWVNDPTSYDAIRSLRGFFFYNRIYIQKILSTLPGRSILLVQILSSRSPLDRGGSTTYYSIVQKAHVYSTHVYSVGCARAATQTVLDKQTNKAYVGSKWKPRPCFTRLEILPFLAAGTPAARLVWLWCYIIIPWPN
jgi:hypothetical protein